MEGKEEDAEPQHCLHFGVLGGGVYCRGTGGRWDQEEGGMRREGGSGKKGGGASVTAPGCRLCLCACPHTVEINLPSVELWTQRGERCPNTTRTHASRN